MKLPFVMVYFACLRAMERQRLVDSYHEVKNAFLNTGISWRTYGLIACFALSSWITVNGIWSELPVIVLSAPEKWQIASYTVVIIQLGFAGPLLFSLANRLCPRIFNEKFTIYLLFIIGILSCLFLALWYKETTMIDGKAHSVVLMVLVFFLALVDCTSSVVFLTFMSFYDPRYITALYIGESLCGLLPGVAAIIQGSPTCNHFNHTGQNSTSLHDGVLFSGSVYFIILLLMMLTSCVAFICLNTLPFAKKEQSSEVMVVSALQEEDTEELIEEAHLGFCCDSSCLSSSQLLVFFFIQAIVSGFSFGILPSLSPYSFEPYGGPSYHLGKILSWRCFLNQISSIYFTIFVEYYWRE